MDSDTRHPAEKTGRWTLKAAEFVFQQTWNMDSLHVPLRSVKAEWLGKWCRPKTLSQGETWESATFRVLKLIVTLSSGLWMTKFMTVERSGAWEIK